jgi:arylsulfatase A-like enzyme
MPSRPHIVYVTGDGLKASATGIGGNPLVPTPSLDDLAARGVHFTRTFAASSICTPSRATVFTGVHPLVHQVTCHQNRVPLNLPQLSELLLASGYHTAACGHYEQNRDLSRGWVQQCDEGAPGCLRRAYTRWQQSGRSDVGCTSGALDCEGEPSHSSMVTERALKMVDGALNTADPLFLHVAYNDPHSPTFAPPPFDTLVDPAAVPLPPRGDAETTPAWQAKAVAAFGTDETGPDALRKLVAVHYGMVAHLDAQLRALHDGLAARGMLENTWFIFCSDHGEFVGEKGMFSHTESLYDCLLHVPLVICPPPSDGLTGGTRVDHLVDLTDLFPTVCGLAGVEAPEYVQGHDLISWCRSGAEQPLRDAVFAQVGDYHGGLGDTLPGGRPECTRHPGLLQGVRTEQWRYTRDPDFGDEVYDLAADPDELVNRVGAPDTPTAELRARVDGWERDCLALRDQLGVIAGFRGTDPGWE